MMLFANEDTINQNATRRLSSNSFKSAAFPCEILKDSAVRRFVFLLQYAFDGLAPLKMIVIYWVWLRTVCVHWDATFWTKYTVWCNGEISDHCIFFHFLFRSAILSALIAIKPITKNTFGHTIYQIHMQKSAQCTSVAQSKTNIIHTINDYPHEVHMHWQRTDATTRAAAASAAQQLRLFPIFAHR